MTPLLRSVRVPLRSLLLAGAAALASCGGGGGGGPGGGPTTPAPAPETELAGTPLAYDVWKVLVPGGLTTTRYTNTVAFDQPGCRITLWPPVAASGTLDDQALGLMGTMLTDASHGGVVGVDGASPLQESYHRRGFTPDGFPFVELSGELLNTGGARSGDRSRILAVQLGGQVAVMLGEELYGTGGCLREVLDPQAWTSLAYSISFPSLHAPNPSALRDALVGGWFGAEVGPYVNLAWSDVFSGNGHHSDLIGVQTWQAMDQTTVLTTFSAWQGNSYWAASGNKLTIWPLDVTRAPTTSYFRISAEYNPAQPSGWLTYLYRLGTSAGAYSERWSTKD